MPVFVPPSLLVTLLESPEPSLRWRTWVEALRQDPQAPQAQADWSAIPAASRTQALLAERDKEGEIPLHPYKKWQGAHWVLGLLAEMGYPHGDLSLVPLWKQECAWLLSADHQRGIQTVDGRTRRCASQEGFALFSSLRLGLADQNSEELAERLLGWQWPDGGWNCDKRPQAHHSSFMETLLPMRGLARFADASGDPRVRKAVERAAEVFLKRGLFRRESDGSVIDLSFLKLHWPVYWHYDILAGLKTMAESGFLGDPRCNEALDQLEGKQLADGGFPADGKFYQVTERGISGRSRVDWEPSGGKKTNPWVTVDALAVLHLAGRWKPPHSWLIPGSRIEESASPLPGGSNGETSQGAQIKEKSNFQIPPRGGKG
ncbi:MAG: hypothetical protein WCO14_02595 [bacterium]